jgi:hypothetical protein
MIAFKTSINSRVQLSISALRKSYKQVIAIVLASLLLFACQSSQNPGEQVLDYAKSNQDYNEIVARVKAQKANAGDYDNLLRIYPLTQYYDPKNKREQAAKLMSQNYMQREYWQDCLDVNKRVLVNNFLSLTAHYGASICAAESGNTELGQFHNQILDNLIEAIWRTGDGKTPQTALYITSVDDLYAFIQLHQLVVTGQSLTYVDDLPIQQIQLRNPQNQRPLLWYFDVTPQFRRGIIDGLEQRIPK